MIRNTQWQLPALKTNIFSNVLFACEPWILLTKDNKDYEKVSICYLNRRHLQ